MGTRWPSRTTKLTQASPGKPASSSMVRPSAGEPALIVSRCTPLGSPCSRTPSAQGSGSTTRICTCSNRAAAGVRLPCTTTENTTTTSTMPKSRSAPGRCAENRKVPSKIGTAPFSPANSTKLRSLPGSLAGIRHSPTRTGRITNASAAPRMSPGIHTSARKITPRSMVRPSATKATISARLASAEWNRSISRLYGARPSPSTIPAAKTARNPEPRASVAAPNSSSAQARVRSGYSPSLGSGTRRVNHSSAAPPATPTAAPTPIWSRNSPPTFANAPALRPPAAIRLAISAIPTGSFAPDSPSRMMPLRPEISRRPRTENTTAGSVGATAVATSTETYQARPNAMWASRAPAATVRNVPSTPTTAIGAAAERNRDQPMCMPPSNKMQTRATVTTSSTAWRGGACRAGMTLTATAAPTRTSAGEGIRSHSVRRFDSTATSPTAPASSTITANGSVSVTTALPGSAKAALAELPAAVSSSGRRCAEDGQGS